MAWTEHFSPVILDRGRRYAQYGNVRHMDVSDGEVSAYVQGSDLYDVKIRLQEGEPVEMYCSCPYAERGANCKHMAAVLYKLDEERGNESVSEPAEDLSDLQVKAAAPDPEKVRESIGSLIEEADADMMHSFLTAILTEQPRLRERFERLVSKGLTPEGIEAYKRKIDAVVRDIEEDSNRDYYDDDDYYGWGYYGRYRDDDDDDEEDVVSEELDPILEDIRTMAADGDVRDAFEISTYLLNALGGMESADSYSYTVSRASSDAASAWKNILPHMDGETKKRAFEWTRKHTDPFYEDTIGRDMDRILLEMFPEAEYTEPVLQYLASKLQSKSLGYRSEEWAKAYLARLEAAKADEKELLAACRKFWSSQYMRDRYVEKSIERKEYDHALDALDDSIQAAYVTHSSVTGYREQKKQIYKTQHDTDGYRKELWHLLLDDVPGDVLFYKELKDTYSPQEWEKVRERIFEKLAGSDRVARLYAEDDLIDRLLQYVQEQPTLTALFKYDSKLAKDYPEYVLQRYERAVSSMAPNARTRPAYSDMANIVRRMRRVKGGPEIVDRLLAEWRQKYPNRRVMHEELRKA